MADVILDIREDRVATVTLNRPERHNAFDDTIIDTLQQSFDSLGRNQQVRVVVLKANGKSFSAGADLGWMRKMANYSEQENFHDALAMAQCFHTLATLPKPTIAVVQGPAYGGGVGLVATCDIVVAAEDATFCFPEVRLGLIPAVISPYINLAMGKRAVRRYSLTGETFSADEAKMLGLVHSIVPQTQLDEETERFIKQLSRCGPEAMAEVKARLTTYLEPSKEKLIEDTARWIAAIRCSPEGKEGLEAFLEKRPPHWIKKS